MFFFSYFPSARPPRVRTTTFLPCNRHIYRTELGQHRTSCCVAHSSVPIRPSYVVSVRRFGILPVSGLLTLDIRLPSDSTSRWTPLPSANASYCRARSGLSPPSYCPCRAHHSKEPALSKAGSLIGAFSLIKPLVLPGVDKKALAKIKPPRPCLKIVRTPIGGSFSATPR